MNLTDRLLELARIWTAANGRELSTLATQVARDGKFFARLRDGGGCTVAMLERFLRFFRDPASWPDSSIPEAANLIMNDPVGSSLIGDAIKSGGQSPAKNSSFSGPAEVLA